MIYLRGIYKQRIGNTHILGSHEWERSVWGASIVQLLLMEVDVEVTFKVNPKISLRYQVCLHTFSGPEPSAEKFEMGNRLWRWTISLGTHRIWYQSPFAAKRCQRWWQKQTPSQQTYEQWNGVLLHPFVFSNLRAIVTITPDMFQETSQPHSLTASPPTSS